MAVDLDIALQEINQMEHYGLGSYLEWQLTWMVTLWEINQMEHKMGSYLEWQLTWTSLSRSLSKRSYLKWQLT